MLPASLRANAAARRFTFSDSGLAGLRGSRGSMSFTPSAPTPSALLASLGVPLPPALLLEVEPSCCRSRADRTAYGGTTQDLCSTFFQRV